MENIYMRINAFNFANFLVVLCGLVTLWQEKNPAHAGPRHKNTKFHEENKKLKLPSLIKNLSIEY
jgi:hypothetical protein